MFKEEFKIIGARILYYRKLRGMTQEFLATEVGISPSYLCRIEGGKYQGIPLATLLSIAEKLGVNIIKLLEEA